MMINDSSIPDNSKQARLNLVSICIALTCAFVVQTMLIISVPLTAVDLGVTPFLVGITVSAPYLLPLILAIPLGDLITRKGAKYTMVVGSYVLILGIFLILTLPSFRGLIAGQLLIGIAHMIMMLAGQAVVSELGQGKSLERAFGWYTTSLSAGQLIGPLLAGWLLDGCGGVLTFKVAAGVAAIALIGCYGLTGSAKRGRSTDQAMVGYRAQMSLLRVNPGVQVSIALTVAVAFALSAYGNFLPVYLESLGISATTIGALASLRAMCAMIVRLFMPVVIDWVGSRTRAMVVSALLVVIGLMPTGFVDGIVLLGVCAVLMGVGSGISQPIAMVVLAESVNPVQRSGTWGLRLMGTRLVQFLAPMLLGLLAEIFPFSLTFLIGGGVVSILIVLMMSLLPAFSLFQPVMGERNNRP